MSTQIIGNIKSLFSLHGDVDTTKALEALLYMSESDVMNITDINETSEKGLIYVARNGKILDSTSKSEEHKALYKLVPTGLKLRYTNYPLFASFIKINGFWEGAYIGTGIQLFDMYKTHYDKSSGPFCEEYMDLFGGDNRDNDIIGFGLDGITNKIDNEVGDYFTDEDDESHISDLTKALERCKKKIESETKANPKYKKSSKYNKNARKAARLEAHLKKLNQNKEKEQSKKEQEQSETNTESIGNTKPLKLCYNSADEIDWLEVVEIEDTHFNFEDTATKEFNSRLISNIGSIDSDEEFVNKDSIITEDTNQVITSDEDYNNFETEVEISISAVDDLKNDTVEIDKDSYIQELADESSELDSSILESMDHDSSEDDFKSSKYKVQLQNDFISNVYENLLCKEYWRINGKNRLGFYLKGVFIIVDSNRKKNKGSIRGNGYVLSRDGKSQVVNTGLLDKYGNYLYVLDHTPKVEDFYSKILTLVVNKVLLLEKNFDIADIRQLPSPIKLVNSNSEYLFNGSYIDFDLNDMYHLKHIIIERLYRVPAAYRDEPVEKLCDRMKQAIQEAIKMYRTNYNYIVPTYNFARNRIQFLLPWHFDTKLDEKAELTLVVGCNKGLWTVYTVLLTDDAYDDARLICKPSIDWLKPNGV